MEEIREKQSKMPTSTNSQGRKFTKSDTKNLLPKMCNLMRYCREVGYVMAGNTYGPRKHMPPVKTGGSGDMQRPTGWSQSF